MNELAPLIRQIPEPSPSLAACFAPSSYGARGPDDAPLILPAPVPVPSQVAEAVRLLAEYERASFPADRSRVAAWVALLAKRVAMKPTADEIAGRTDGLSDTCANLPAWVFGQATLTAASAAFNFFPSVQALHGLLSEAAAPFLDTLAGLRRVAAHRPEKTGSASVSDRLEPTDAEREQVRQSAATIRAELDAAAERAGGGPRGAVRACWASNGHLLAAYEAQVREGGAGAGAALIRVNMLKAKLAKQVAENNHGL